MNSCAHKLTPATAFQAENPLGLQAHDCDVKALLRLAAAYNIPNASNEATADCIISALAAQVPRCIYESTCFADSI